VSAPSQARDPASGDRLVLAVSGMTCASCVRHVQRALERLPGVVEARVNLATERAEVVRATDAAEIDQADLIEAVRDAGYEARLLETSGIAPGAKGQRPASGLEEAEARQRDEQRTRSIELAVSVVLSAVVVGLAMADPRPAWSGWVQLVLSAVVVGWLGSVFHRGALRALRHGTATMDTLVSLGSLVAFVYSAVALVALPGDPRYFDTASLIVTLVGLGKLLELVTRRRAGDAISALAELQPRSARRVSGPGRLDGTEVDVTSLGVGDIVVVRSGERVPADSLVVWGVALVDESMLSGEPLPVRREPGERLVGGTVCLSGPLWAEVHRPGGEGVLAEVAEAVDRLLTSRSRSQRLADRAAAVFVPTILGVALVTGAAWALTGHGAIASLVPAIAVLVVACPCALGLATPVALMVAGGKGAASGILLRDPDALERARGLRTVVVDKTGTLTLGRPEVVGRHDLEPDADDALLLAAALEAAATHPLARAIEGALGVRPLDLGTPSALRQLDGGLVGRVGTRSVLVGSPRCLEREGVHLVSALAGIEAEVGAGRSVVVVAVDGVAKSVLGISDPVRSGAALAVRRLGDLGLQVVLATGDHEAAALRVASATGIGEVHADLDPKGKADLVRHLQAQGPVAMVGDGVNDALALASADLGIAMGSGTGVAMAAGALTLVDGDLGAVADAIVLARRTAAVIRENLGWAFGYNALLVPLAAFGIVPPVAAAAAMSASSVSVVANALRLRRVSLGGHERASSPGAPIPDKEEVLTR